MIRQRSRGLQTLFRLSLCAVCTLTVRAPAFAQVLCHQIERGYGGSRLTTDLLVRHINFRD